MTSRADHASLDALFRPRSIAVIGASSDPRKIGGRPVALLQRAGFAGVIHPINPAQTEIAGLRAYISLDDVPGPVDQVVVAVAAKHAVAAVDACVRKGVRAIVMFTAGLGEADGAGRAAQDTMAARCRAGGVRLLGPNSLGVFSPGDGVFSTFSAAFDTRWPRRGRIGIASQSGAIGTYCFAMMDDRGFGVSRFVATGNEADVDVADCIAWLADDDETEVILAYMEGCQDGRRLRAALHRAACRKKPVVMLKAGASDSGAAAAASHTGSLAGQDAVFAAVLKEAGTHRAGSIRELVSVAQAASLGCLPRGRRVGIVTVSGGAGVMLADAAEARGLTIPPLPARAQEAILALVPFSNPANPVDATAQVANDWTLLPRILEVMADAGEFDTLIGFLAHMGRDEELMETLAPALVALRRRHPERMMILVMFCLPAIRATLEQAGITIVDEPIDAVLLADALAGLACPIAVPRPGDTAHRAMLPDGFLDEAAAKRVLAGYGIPFVPEQVARDADEAASAACRLGFPVAMKVLSADINHKSDVGGVRLGLQDEAAVRRAWQEMMHAVAIHAPQARLGGALVAPMVTDGVEVVIGFVRDPVFGPVTMFGLGGVFIEVFKDVVFRSGTLDHAGALAMIHAIRGLPLLQGARGRPAVDIDAVAQALVAMSRFGAEHEADVASAEINPFLARPHGGLAVDGLIVRG